ncbi:MAG: preprotein translocase subunit SecA [Betaproteobacteria bacterium]|nr:preprotein translocase subunit SecA [Betaproteobacteria bacterium]
MVQGILKKIFGSRNDRLLKIYFKMVEEINSLEAGLKKLSDDELKAKTAEFKERLTKGETLDDLLPEAFAVAREGSLRALGMRHFDVQIAAGIALHQGKIAEMRTGEGKTLMATLPVYLNALSGRGVHVVTVNDYLARRDSEWMGRLYSFLGLTTGLNLPETNAEEKQEAYACDITYGTNNEFGFDYLRDNLEHERGGRRQKPLNYAIVDEVDSILIDEARTPLIISGQADDHTDLYYKMNEVAPLLTRMESEPKTDQPDPPGDFWVDEKGHQVHLSEEGFGHAEEVLARLSILAEGDSLYAAQNIGLMHHLYAALRAHYLFHRDQHYVVQDGEVIIVDEFTGRLMTGRRWSDGLHQAVEAKENVTIQAENQTLASITFQNYFRMYAKLSGMTGTADTEAYEFQEIYRLETVIIPTHRDMVREDRLDQVYRTEREKYTAIINGIKDCYNRGQPVLVGTTSIENSELLAGMLEKEKLPHQVLNAKQHAKEAEIIAQAGRPKMITIATNMAGRGTDIVLGGGIEKSISIIEAAENLTQTEKDLRVGKLKSEWDQLHAQVIAAGGLHIIGTERHESRRVDNQLRGRAGRQGDPGSSRFYLSLEDPLLRIFAGDRVRMIMDKLKMPDGEAIEAGIVTRSIESAQRKVEARNFDMRKQLLEYDDVANDQRKVVYAQRNELLDAEDITDTVDNLRRDVLSSAVDIYVPAESVEEQWEIDSLVAALKQEWNIDAPVHEWIKAEPDLGPEGIRERVLATADQTYTAKVEAAGRENWSGFERGVMLQAIDQHWRDHLAALDHLRQGIHLRGYAQKNPKQEYKRESFELFTQFLETVKSDVTKKLLTTRLQTQEEFDAVNEQARREAEALEARMRLQHALASAGEAAPEEDDDSPTMKPFKQFGKKVGRNELCPCGSGKKYKHCHGTLA